MDHWVGLQTPDPVALVVSALTAVDGMATATTEAPHGYQTGDEVEIAGANEPAFTGRVIVIVTSDTGFTYAVAPDAPSPATGAITATYVGDGQGGRRDVWSTVDTVAAEVIPLSGAERVQAMAVASFVQYRLRIWYRPDVRPTWRVVWEGRTLQIGSVVRMNGRRDFLLLDVGETR